MEDMKAAMRSGNKQDLEVIRFAIAAIKNAEIDQGEYNDDQVVKLIVKQIKEMRDSMGDYAKAGRTDLVEKDQHSIEVLQKYLPTPLTESEIDAVIDQVIADNPGGNMGMIIGKVNQQAAGRADGAVVAQKVRAKLA
ncbi:MAG: uncharacterized protein QG639_903 [Patescibacteria group bacterium]|nr:uncharacterized protein [Patescibacteria group bacterium]